MLEHVRASLAAGSWAPRGRPGPGSVVLRKRRRALGVGLGRVAARAERLQVGRGVAAALGHRNLVVELGHVLGQLHVLGDEAALQRVGGARRGFIV